MQKQGDFFSLVPLANIIFLDIRISELAELLIGEEMSFIMISSFSITASAKCI